MIRNVNKNCIVILLMWVILTSINYGKAFHIDDAFYLNAAVKVVEDPMKPMSGEINWTDTTEPIYMNNQPPLWFYLIGIFVSVFGFTHLALHGLVSIFSFLALFFFYRILKVIRVKSVTVLILLFALNPAFVVNQNVMTDVPLLSMILGFVYSLLLARNDNSWKNYLLSILFLSMAIFIKYSALPLLLLYPCIALVDKNWKSFLPFLIVIFLLILWSLWNYWEFGQIHILGRSSSIQWKQIFTFISGLGGIATFCIFILTRMREFLGFIFIFTIILLATIVGFDLIGSDESKIIFQIFFCGIGVLTITFLLFEFTKEIRNLSEFIHSNNFIFFLILLFMGSFLVLKPPFMATRHILLLIPFILIILDSYFHEEDRKVKVINIAFVIFTGTALGISDRMVANYYKDQVSNLDFDKNTTVWSLGHWGWQWYSEKENFNTYDFVNSAPAVGDILVYPKMVSRQKLDPDIVLELIDKRWNKSDLSTFFYVSNGASMYSNRFKKPVWYFSKEPVDTIMIYQIKSINAKRRIP